jgi:hypothetical protein
MRMGAMLDYMHSWQELDALALEAAGELSIGRHGFLGFDVGPLWARPVDSSLGTVSTYGATAKLRGGACLPVGGPLSACLGARAGAAYLHFSGDANTNVRARAGSSWLVHVDGLAGLAIALRERVRLRAELALGGPLHGVRASDGQRTLVGATSLLLSSQIGLTVSL